MSSTRGGPGGKKLEQRSASRVGQGGRPCSEGEMAKFQELVLRPRGARDEVALREAEDGEGLVHLHDQLVKAAVEIKATATSLRSRTILCA